MLPCREAVREGLRNWALATKFADEHEKEMKDAQAKGLPHWGWQLLYEAQTRLDELAADSLSDEQKNARPQELPPEWQPKPASA